MKNSHIDERRGSHDPALAASADSGRFAFGDNWLRYVDAIDDSPIRHAEQSIRQLLQVETLEGLRFLDAGSGSGLFSLAARRLGADVSSFDFDKNSVQATRQLKDRYRQGDNGWSIRQGSVLDERFLAGLGTYDVVCRGAFSTTPATCGARSRMCPAWSIRPDGCVSPSTTTRGGRATSGA